MLRAWRTPFESEKFPSIWVSSNGGPLDTTTVNVGWPAQWSITFERVVGLKVCDESYDNNKRFWVERDLNDLCTYTWEDSPWLADFSSDYVNAMEDGNVIHYVLLGGDYNVELLAFGKVSIDSVPSTNSD